MQEVARSGRLTPAHVSRKRPRTWLALGPVSSHVSKRETR
jgi:hypothetical protein